jgi:hypothetical protein
VLGKWNEEKASSKEAVSKWNDQEIGVREGPLLSSREYDEHSSPAFRWSYHLYFLPTFPSLVREALISQ